MSQHDYNIANGGGAAVRADINNALLAILSQNAGPTAPTTTKPFMPWYDTTTGIFKIRNAADTAWVTFAAGAIQDASIAQAKLAANVAGNGPAFSLYATTTTSLSTSVFTKVAFNGTEFDTTGGMISSSRFTPTIAGYYYITGSAYFSAAAESFVEIYKNGSGNKRGTDHGAQVYSRMTSGLVYLNGSTDYVEIIAYQASGSTLTVSASAGQTFFQGFLARAA